MSREQFEALIQKKLGRMKVPESRQFVKQAVEDGLMEVLRFADQLEKGLEARILSEIECEPDYFDLYTTVVARKDYDPTHSYLKPMLESDTLEPAYDLGELEAKLRAGETAYLFRVYIDLDFLALKPLIGGGREYKAEVRTKDGGAYGAKVRLYHSEAYLSRIEELYKLFISNQVRWVSVNCPYLYKFIDVRLTALDPLPEKSEIQEIKVDFGEHTPYIIRDLLPLWNVENISVKSVGFSEPILERVTYQHTVPLTELGAENGFLVDYHEHEFEDVRRMANELVVVTAEEKVRAWSLTRIYARKLLETEKPRAAVYSNARSRGFARAVAEHCPIVIRTQAEVFRRVNAFQSAETVRLTAVEAQSGTLAKSETYSVNPFLRDEIRIGEPVNSLILRFACGEPDNLTRDVMSFLVSEIAAFYPEYRCIGMMEA